MTFEFPVLVRLALSKLLLPKFTLPKLRLVGLAVSRKVAATPVPLRAIVSGELGALLTSETVPVTLPAAPGVKATLNVALLPAAIVSGTVKPVMLNPVAEALAAEIVMLAVPELLNVKVCVPLLPTSTFPKLKLEGLAVSVPCTPVPLKVIVAGEFVALLATLTLPVTLPAAAGAKATLRVTV